MFAVNLLLRAIKAGSGGGIPSITDPWPVQNDVWYGDGDGSGGYKDNSVPPPSGTPEITSASVTGGVLSIAGSNFGTKPQAAPALMYEGGVGYLNGVAEDDLNTYSDLDAMVYKPTIWGNDIGTRINKQNLRYAGQNATMMAYQGQSNVGAFVPFQTLPTPVGDTMYFRMKFRPQFNQIQYYYNITVNAPTGTFEQYRDKVGEQITFGAPANFTGTLVSLIDYGGGLWKIFFTSPNSAGSLPDYEGVTVTGVNSAATTTCKTGVDFVALPQGSEKPLRFDAYNASGQKHGANGFNSYNLRIESVNAHIDGVHEWDDGAPFGSGSSPYVDYSYLNSTFAENWHTLELIYDGRQVFEGDAEYPEGYAMCLMLTDGVDPEVVTNPTPRKKIPLRYIFGSIPNINLHGLDASSDCYQGVFCFGEQYIDNSLAAVFISEEPIWTDAIKNNEIQQLTAFGDASITANFAERALSGAATFYAYVRNDDNKVNENGYIVSVT